MADLINRQAAINALCNDYCGGHQDCKHYPKCENLRSVQNLPSAQPEIIRCKDCTYYRWEIDMCDYPYATAHNVVHEDDYCSKAERKSDG